MINRLSFVKVFNYWLRKIQEICNPSVFSRLWCPAVLQTLPCQLHCEMHGCSGSNSEPASDSSVAAETRPSSAMESHYFNKKSMHTKGTLGGEEADVHVQRERGAKGEGMCLFVCTVCECKYVLNMTTFHSLNQTKKSCKNRC